MKMKLEIYRREDGLFAWRLRAANGKPLANDAGQGYVRKGTCINMARRVIMPAVPIDITRSARVVRADVELVDLT